MRMLFLNFYLQLDDAVVFLQRASLISSKMNNN